jgi:hypothetical protein
LLVVVRFKMNHYRIAEFLEDADQAVLILTP